MHVTVKGERLGEVEIRVAPQQLHDTLRYPTTIKSYDSTILYYTLLCSAILYLYSTTLYYAMLSWCWEVEPRGTLAETCSEEPRGAEPRSPATVE